jgi:site-specific recombinase XerD
MERAGIESEYRGSHVFRHSLATQMLNHGTSLPEIGDLLRHLGEAILTIRQSKFGKTRLVPLHTSTRDVLADYARRRDRLLRRTSSPCFFLNDHGRRLEGSAVRRTFYDLSRHTGLRGPEDHKGPRLHDFRHRADSPVMPTVSKETRLSSVWRGVSCLADRRKSA